MSKIREIKRIVAGVSTSDGAGVKLIRLIGHADTKDFDPFLLLDGFDSTNSDDYIKGFPWHPHRGIETVTYMISGSVAHGDSLGNSGRISDGDCQWMTAGSGIIHQEMPQVSDRVYGTQLWINLPAKHKMAPPKYRDILSDIIPVTNEAAGSVRNICGSYKGKPGAIKGDYVDITYLDVKIKSGAEWTLQTNPEDTLFIYILRGAGIFGSGDSAPLQERNVALFGPGDTFAASAADGELRFLLLSGKPLAEPIAWGGPIVMNTREELSLAFKELDEGTFIKQ